MACGLGHEARERQSSSLMLCGSLPASSGVPLFLGVREALPVRAVARPAPRMASLGSMSLRGTVGWHFRRANVRRLPCRNASDGFEGCGHACTDMVPGAGWKPFAGTALRTRQRRMFSSTVISVAFSAAVCEPSMEPPPSRVTLRSRRRLNALTVPATVCLTRYGSLPTLTARTPSTICTFARG